MMSCEFIEPVIRTEPRFTARVRPRKRNQPFRAGPCPLMICFRIVNPTLHTLNLSDCVVRSRILRITRVRGVRCRNPTPPSVLPASPRRLCGSDRATKRRFSISYLREIGWVGLPAPEIIDYVHTNRRMSSMSAGIKPTQNEISENSSLPNSRRVYVEGKLPGVRVPFREIAQSSSRNFDGTLVANPPVRVYDTSGPWGDPAQQCNVREGLRKLG